MICVLSPDLCEHYMNFCITNCLRFEKKNQPAFEQLFRDYSPKWTIDKLLPFDAIRNMKSMSRIAAKGKKFRDVNLASKGNEMS